MHAHTVYLIYNWKDIMVLSPTSSFLTGKVHIEDFVLLDYNFVVFSRENHMMQLTQFYPHLDLHLDIYL